MSLLKSLSKTIIVRLVWVQRIVQYLNFAQSIRILNCLKFSHKLDVEQQKYYLKRDVI